jgi:hypothetical protein
MNPSIVLLLVITFSVISALNPNAAKVIESALTGMALAEQIEQYYRKKKDNNPTLEKKSKDSNNVDSKQLEDESDK